MLVQITCQKCEITNQKIPSEQWNSTNYRNALGQLVSERAYEKRRLKYRYHSCKFQCRKLICETEAGEVKEV